MATVSDDEVLLLWRAVGVPIGRKPGVPTGGKPASEAMPAVGVISALARTRRPAAQPRGDHRRDRATPGGVAMQPTARPART
jgi:hypothetical protein